MSCMTTHRETTRTKWLQLYRAFEENGQTTQAFCAERGVNYYTFKGWQQRFNKECSGAFREIPIATAGSEAAYSVVLRNGRELRLGVSFSERRVRKLIEIHDSCCTCRRVIEYLCTVL